MNRALLRRCLNFFLTLATLLFCLGCMPHKSASLRVGINSWPGYGFLYLAQEKGFYRDEGVAVRLVEFSDLSDTRRAYERGQLDVFATTVVEVLQARDHSSRSPQIVQVVDCSEGADVLIARPDFTSVNSLSGARIGVELASLGIYLLVRAIETNGLFLDDVKMLPMDQVSMESAFRKGELDAIVTYPPVSTRLLLDNKARKLFSSARIPGEVIDVIAVEEEVISQRSGDVAKLLRAYRRAIAYTQQHPDEAYRIMAERGGITPEEFRAALTEGIRMFTEPDQAAYLGPDGKLETVIANTDRILRQSGQIKRPNRPGKLFTAAFAGIASSP